MSRLEAGICHISDSVLLVESLLCRDQRSVCDEGEMYSRIWDLNWIGKGIFLEKSRNRGCERILSSIKQNGKISRFQNHFSLVNYLFLTRFVWNSVRSTFRAPSNLNDAVIEETIWAIRRFKFVYVGLKQPTIFNWISVNPNPTEPNRDSFCRCRKLLRCQPWKCNPNARESCESLGLNCTAQPK